MVSVTTKSVTTVQKSATTEEPIKFDVVSANNYS